MNIKNGLYLFPEGEYFLVYGVFMFGLVEMGKASAGELLIEFLDFVFQRNFLSSKIRIHSAEMKSITQ